MSIFWQHAAIIIPSISGVIIALINRRTIRRIEIAMNGRIDNLKLDA